MLQAGFMAMDPRNGYVRAWVGSRDFAEEQFDHVEPGAPPAGLRVQAFRVRRRVHDGHAARPTTLIDEPVTIRAARRRRVGARATCRRPPTQPMTLRDGLAYSKNTITAQLMLALRCARRTDCR